MQTRRVKYSESPTPARATQVVRPGDANEFAGEFEKTLSELIAQRDPALYIFLEAFEFRKGFEWLGEGNSSQGLTNALLNAISGYPSSADQVATSNEKPVASDIATRLQKEWPSIEQSLKQAAKNLILKHGYSLIVLRRIQSRNGWDLITAMRRLLLGYAASSRYALSGDPW